MKRHSKSSILFNKIDIRLSRAFYGNTTGFMRNIKGRNQIISKIDENKADDPANLRKRELDSFSVQQ